MGRKSARTRKIEEAKSILTSLGLPPQQRNERSALTLLALASVSPTTDWNDAQASLLRIWDIMAFIGKSYGKVYAANSRETIRRQTIHQFVQARLVDQNKDDPLRPTNSGKNVYSLTDEAMAVVRVYGTTAFGPGVASFLTKFGALDALYKKTRASNLLNLKTPNGLGVKLSPGKHNRLQVAIIDEFRPRFAPGSELLYVGDTAKKHLVTESSRLSEVGIPITEHDKLPDVILYLPEKDWLFLIEACTTHGPVSPKRYSELESFLQATRSGRIYVTAFQDAKTFRKYAAEIAWETEVWIAEMPDHMIHFNGPRFLGPYPPRLR